ncbi:MAG: hypothetical protein WB998_05820 [Solirubrobacteraceae bacterium]
MRASVRRGAPRPRGGAHVAILPLVLLAIVVALCPTGSAAAAEVATWRVVPVKAPKANPGTPESTTPVDLGRIGDIEFWAPNRGLLITAGDPPTVPAGVWAYDGVQWHELAEVCGGGEKEGEGGRIAWAGPDEFFTVSAGRPGQAGQSSEFIEPPALVDNTLCHFSGGQVLASYAHPAFEADSYQTMQGAACFEPADCWFGGDDLPEPQIGAFQLHWNGASLEAEPYAKEGHAIEDILPSEGRLYESVRVATGDPVAVEEVREPPVLRKINPAGVQPTFQSEARVPLYGEDELAEALDFLHLSSAEGALWGAAGPKQAQAGEAGQVTVVRRSKGVWSQLIGPDHPLEPVLPSPSEEEALLGKREAPGEVRAREAIVSSVAAEPGSESAWIALKAPGVATATTRALIVRVSAEGKVLEAQTLPSNSEEAEGIGPKGAAEKLSCPAANDCWLATTQGWLFHLAPEVERTLPLDEDPNFDGLITYRPRDLGLPQIPPDAPPPDTSGLIEEPPDYGGAFAETKRPPTEAKVPVPLLSGLHSRLIGGTTLQLSFHLAVKARVRLLAKRHKALVASTPTKTLKAGKRSLLLRLNPRRWPTKLSLQTHALAPLPTRGSRSPNVSAITTGYFTLPRNYLLDGSGLLP